MANSTLVHMWQKFVCYRFSIHEARWCHWRHCHNTPPCWRYTLCEQQLCKLRKCWHSMQ